MDSPVNLPKTSGVEESRPGAWARIINSNLRFQPSSGASRDPDSDAQERARDRISKFTKICEQIASLTGKLKKTEILSNYLISLTDEELPLVATFLTGHALPRTTGQTLQVGWAVIRKALIQASGLSETHFRSISAGYGDAGRVAYEVLLGRTTRQGNGHPGGF